MQVETYEQTEVTSEGIPDNDAEAIQLIERLGLKGQQTLIGSGGTSAPAVIPFRKVTAEECDTYALLFPEVVEVEDYKASPIPIRVLQVIAHCRELGLHMVVWYPSDAEKRDDPILVGYQERGQHGPRYLDRRKALLLARWGDALKPLQELKREAVEIARQRIRQALGMCRAELERDIASLDTFADATVLRAGVSLPSYHSRFDRSV
jgi:hypothetical protein